jgi:hypothetical protein
MRYYFIMAVVALSQLVVISCDSQGKQKRITTSVNSDSVIAKAYISPTKRNYINSDSQAIYFENAIKLDPIRNGYDSFQLRISYASPLERKEGGSIRTLIIKRKDQKWNGEVIKIKPLRSNDSLFYVVTSQRRNIVPRSGWDSFITQLFDYKLLNTSFYTLEEENPVVHAPTTVIFQIANVKQFREYRYFVPSVYEKKYWQIEELRKIIKLLETEVGFTIYSTQ